MTAFYLLAAGATLSALAVALAPDRRCATLALLCALASLSGLHLLLGADLLGLGELGGCLVGLWALVRRPEALRRLSGAPALLAGGALLLGLLLGRTGTGAVPPIRHLWLVAALLAGGLFAALGPGQLRLLIGAQVLLGAASVHCLALAQHVQGRPSLLVKLFVAALLLGQLGIGLLLLRGARAPARAAGVGAAGRPGRA